MQKQANKQKNKKGKLTKKAKKEESESDLSSSVLCDDGSGNSDCPFDQIEKATCAYCSVAFTTEEEESLNKVVVCEMCPRRAHKLCTRDPTLIGLDDVDDIRAYPFICFNCD